MRKAVAIFSLVLLNALGVSAQDKLTVFFDFDKYDLNEAAITQLKDWMIANPKTEVSKIYGFCDWKGTNDYNDSLSMKRVKSVFNYLQQRNVKVTNGYEIRGFGEDFKQSKVQSENRKVLIVYDSKQDELPKNPTLITEDIPLPLQFKQAKTGDRIRLKNINFYNMTPRILPKSKPVLIELLCALQDNPTLKIEIQGHICCQKTFDINELSIMRARAIYNYLVTQKINRKRLSYKGYGTSDPIYPIPEKSKEEEEENRRVEILVLDN